MQNKYMCKAMLFCIALLVLFFLSFVVRSITTKILVQKFHMNNLFTQVVLYDNEELQQINGLYSFSILAQANVLLSQLKYLETGNFEGSFSTSNIPEIVPTEIKDEVDDLANEFKGDLDL